MLEQLLEICEAAVKTYSPVKSNNRRKNPIPRDRKILMRCRAKLRKALILEAELPKISRIKSKLTLIEYELQTSYRNQQKNEEKRTVEMIKDNPKFFYSFAKDKQTIPSTVGPFIDERGRYVSDPKMLAIMLSDQLFNPWHRLP